MPGPAPIQMNPMNSLTGRLSPWLNGISLILRIAQDTPHYRKMPDDGSGLLTADVL
jgi:hypothetical protein